MLVKRRVQSMAGLVGLTLLVLASMMPIGSDALAAVNGSADSLQPATGSGASTSLFTAGSCDALNVTTTVNNPVTIQLHCVVLLSARLTYAIVSQPLHGTLAMGAVPGQVVYTPAHGYSGPDTFSYNAASRIGPATAAAVSITIESAAAAPPPAITNVTQLHPTWREGKSLATFARTKASRTKAPRAKAPIGTAFLFTLNQQASIRFAFTQQLPGRKVKGRCVAQTNKNRSQRACKRTVTRGILAFTGHSGVNKVFFQGRISRSKRLGPGHYTLSISAKSSVGKHASARALHFTIVK